MPKPEIDDFFAMNDINRLDLNKVIEKYNYFKNSAIPENYLKKHFRALLQDTDNKMMFRKKEINESPLQEFWTLRFVDMAENNYNNLLINKHSSLVRFVDMAENNYNNLLINKHSSLVLKDLKEIVNCCFEENIFEEIKNYLMLKGIYLYFIEPLQGTKIDGAVYMTSFSTIAIGLTLRFDRLDYILFTLLHELSHIILHSDYLIDCIISIEDSQDIKEIEANRLAKDTIISPEMYRVCKPKRTKTSNDLLNYSKNYNIPPVLLAGIIRRDLNNYKVFNDIIQKYKIKRSDFYE